MRLATGCVAVGAGILLASLSGAVMAADSEGIGPPAERYTATCPHAPTFRAVIDVGHTPDAPGATSARGATEYEFNLRLARKISDDLVAAGFARTVLMVTTEAPRAGLFKRAAHANSLKADLFLSIHHDSVPDAMLQTWQFNGQEQHYNDQFPGYSLFISKDNVDPRGSLAFAHLLGMALRKRGLQYTTHYKEKYMGERQSIMVDAQAGVYRFDQFVVLMTPRMPSVLLEAGSIINRAEELALESPERQMLTANAVVEAVDAFCATRSYTPPHSSLSKRH